MMRRPAYLLVLVSVILAVVAAAAEFAVRLTPLPSLQRVSGNSRLVTDQHGNILYGTLSPDERWRLPIGPKDVSPDYLYMLLTYEDRRFYSHPGVDVLALLRALGQALATGRPVSGASTITMQFVRLLQPGQRGITGKITQILKAAKLERHYGKDQILSWYLTLAPFGGNIEGLRAASLIYFGVEPSHLDITQAAVLVALPQSPERRRPDLYPDEARRSGTAVLRRLAMRNPNPLQFQRSPDTWRLNFAPTRTALLRKSQARHFARRVLSASPILSDTIATTLNLSLQRSVKNLAARSLETRPNEVSAAVLVVRNADMAVRAYVSGIDFFSQEKAGQIDLVTAVRSPGSTLKPVIYGLGFEQGSYHPLSIVTDHPAAYAGGYAPRNFDRGIRGELTIREALIRSLNTTAVEVLARVTPAAFLGRLRAAGVPMKLQDTDTDAGLAVGLGGGGMTLEQLTQAFAAIANGGVSKSLRLTESGYESSTSPNLMSREAAWAVADILADVPPPAGFAIRRAKNGGRRVAFKTGTSYGFRDAWAIGFDRDHTVGVWIGRPDGAPVLRATGIDAAAPLLFRTFDLLPRPEGDAAGVRPRSSPLTVRRWVPVSLRRPHPVPNKASLRPLEILFPSNGSIIADPGEAIGTAGGIPLIASGGMPPYYWFVDGRQIGVAKTRLRWKPEGPGILEAMVIDATGETRAVKFSVD